MAFLLKKNTLLMCLMAFLAFNEAFSQKIGIKLNTGFSRMGSSALKKSMEDLYLEDPYLVESGANSGIGSNWGVGVFYEYTFGEKISGIVEPAISFSRSNIFITTDRSFYENNQGFNHRISSQAEFRMAYINMPFLAKYTLHATKGFYAVGGLGMNIFVKSRINSYEEYIQTPYSDGVVGESNVEKIENTAKLTKFSPVRFDFILGVGKSARLLKRDIDFDIRYNLPLSRTPLYTSDPAFTENSLNNYVFSQEGKEMTEDFSYRNIRNFNLSTFTFTIRYSLYTFNEE
jgi:hypothetical protein